MASREESAAASSSGVGPAEPSTSDAEVKVGEERRGNCVVAFDALWFCYSPGYQLQQYYIHGKVDDCSSKWTDLIDCLKRKTTKYKEEVLQAEAEKRHPVWDIRTHAEAEAFWSREFGHLSGAAGGAAAAAPEGGAEAGEGHHSGRPTLV
ncbi:hypothetical protein ABPG75_012546 [Micractinium tetrahymenae]